MLNAENIHIGNSNSINTSRSTVFSSKSTQYSIQSKQTYLHTFSSLIGTFVLEMDLFFGRILAIDCCYLCFGHNINNNQQMVYSYSVLFTFTIGLLFVLYVFELWFCFVFKWPSLPKSFLFLFFLVVFRFIPKASFLLFVYCFTQNVGWKTKIKTNFLSFCSMSNLITDFSLFGDGYHELF